MIRMLKDAMDYLRKNPKYVLASLPESHKLPSLREWIMRRYGKIYFWKDRVEEYKASAKIFKALIGASLDVRIPTVGRDIGTKAFVDYSCRNYIIEKVSFFIES